MIARCLVVICTLWAAAATAAEVKIFRTDSREAVLQGTLEGVSVDPLGGVELARQIERLASIEEPFAFTAAAHPDGWVVGTGNAGKVLKIDRQGVTHELAVLSEPEVYALRVDDDGAVLAGSSPNGKVYRITESGAEVLFDPEDSYIWDLERDTKGRLLVATGLKGRLYRIDSSGQAETLYQSPDSHVRSIAVQRDGSVLVGTAGQGLLLRLEKDGEVKTLHDAAHPEVLEIALASDGRAYAALLASEASFVDLSGSSGSGENGESSADGEASVSVVVQGTDTVGSRSGSFSGPRSVVLEIEPGGKVKEIAGFQSETVHSLLWQDDQLWIGTGQEGKLYRWAKPHLIHESSLEDRQIVRLVAGPAGAAALTANASAIYRIESESEKEGAFVSSVLDATQVARFGSFLWQGRLPAGAGVEVALRSGMSTAPDATWTAWHEIGPIACMGCAGDRDVAPAGVAHGRYVQWRATLTPGRQGAGPRLESAELSYRQDNLKPQIEKLEVLDPGQILVPSSFNPQNQTFEPWSPNREGIFTTLRLEAPKNGSTKTLWKKGFRTLQWSAKDANSDSLQYRLDFRRDEDAAAELEADTWLPMASEIDKTHYSFDATALPDGIYRFRLTASDGKDRVHGESLSDEKLSESVVIDNSPPKLGSLKRRGSTIEVGLIDALSPMRDIAISIDAGDWQPAPAADGLLDGRRETLQISVPDGARLLLLRASDAAHNVITFDLLTDAQ